MIKQINDLNLERYYINLFNLEYQVTEEDIKEFYKPIPIEKVLTSQSQGIVDIVLRTKEDALAVVEKGSGVSCASLLVN
jgi:hypothetical protein